jgi:hypothetical protein
VLGVEDRSGEAIEVHIDQAGERPTYLGCQAVPVVKDRDVVALADLLCFGRQGRLRWHKARSSCPESRLRHDVMDVGRSSYRRAPPGDG